MPEPLHHTGHNAAATDPLHEKVLHLGLNGVEELHLAVAVMILEVHDNVHHHQHLRRKHVVRPASTFLQPYLKRLQRPATVTNGKDCRTLCRSKGGMLNSIR